MNRSNSKPIMIYHAPYPVGENLSSASRVRPKMMLEAFRELGYDVHEITGLPKERAQAYKQLKLRIKNGARIDFLYSENSTQPNLFATSIRSGFAPFLDSRIFLFCAHRKIPTGQFYRDIYWRFPDGGISGGWLRRHIFRTLYQFDLLALKWASTHIFLPSAEMGEFVPIVPESRMTELPPGLIIKDVGQPPGIKLFYVGGLGSHYRLHELVKAVHLRPDVRLVLCVPSANWERCRQEYEPLLSENIDVVHSDSDGLKKFYEDASACILTVAPSRYRDFASPFKLYEYLGYGKPILATSNTKAGRTIQELGIGATSEYNVDEIGSLLDSLVNDPRLLDDFRTRAMQTRTEHTWKSRALEVVRTLSAN